MTGAVPFTNNLAGWLCRLPLLRNALSLIAFSGSADQLYLQAAMLDV